MPAWVLDTNCYIDASREPAFHAELEAFAAAASPFLYLSAVTAAELIMGVSARQRASIEAGIIAPFRRRGRVVTPSAASWIALGTVLSRLHDREGLTLATVKRSFVFDILIAHSCRELGATLISSNSADLTRIASVLPFDFAAPFPVSK